LYFVFCPVVLFILMFSDNLPYLEELLERLAPNARSIAEWPQQGQLLLDFMDIKRSVAQALEEQDTGRLEARLPHLASVCDRVVRWPTPTVKHRYAALQHDYSGLAKWFGVYYNHFSTAVKCKRGL